MGMERMGDIGPKKFDTVPTPASLDAEPYQKPSLAEDLSGIFSHEEATAFDAMSAASSQEDLNEAIKLFNTQSTEKEASAFNMSLEDMLIENEPLTLANGHRVMVSRTRRGITRFQNPAS